jgi:hypothetical protein
MLNLLQTQTQLTQSGHVPESLGAVSSSSSQPALTDLPLDYDNRDTAATCLGVCLFGVLVVLTLVIYLIRIPSPKTQASIWSILSKVVAAFIAATLVACVRDVSDHFAQDVYKHYSLLIPLLRFLAVLLIVHVLLYFLKWEDTSIATATLGAFVLGFAAIDLFDGVLRVDTSGLGIHFKESPAAACIGTICIAGLLALCMVVATQLRKKAQVSHGVREHARWLEQSEEFEDEAFGIVVGFLLCQVATFGMMDSLFPTLSVPLLEKAAIPLTASIAVDCVYAMWLALGCSVWSFKRRRVPDMVHRTEHLVVRTISMLLAWCVLRWGQLVFWSAQARWFAHADPMLARLIAALAFSVVSLLFVAFITSIVPESQEGGTPCFHVFSGSIGLLIGQSWMTCFYRASSGFGVAAFEAGQEKHWEIQVFLLSLLIALLIPVWKVYFVPHIARKEFGSNGKEAPATPAIDAFIQKSSTQQQQPQLRQHFSQQRPAESMLRSTQEPVVRIAQERVVPLTPYLVAGPQYR